MAQPDERPSDEQLPLAIDAQVDIPDQIAKLARLRDAGILTEKEFEDKKRELLERI